MFKPILLLIFFGLIFSCKSITIQQDMQHTTRQNIMLGTVGEQKDFVLEQDYNHTAIPKYSKPIKIQPITTEFTKATYRAFLKANASQKKNIEVKFADSLKVKPTFLKLEIADRVSVIETLNYKTNKAVFEFLKDNNQAHLVTSISLALNETEMSSIVNADEVFLEHSGVNTYALTVYLDGQLHDKILFNKGVVFTYQTSSCCWKQNNKYQLEIADLVERNDRCPNKTYKSAQKADKKINYFKL